MTPSARWTAALAAALALTLPVDDADARAKKRGAARERPPAARVPAATPLDLSTPEGAVEAMRRIWCTNVDGAPSYWHWRGEVFARRQGERDRALFKVEGLNVRTCVAVNDPVRGQGVRTLSRELLIYVDPATGQPLTRWTNPWTQEELEVVHVANDPVNGAFYPRGPEGQPTQWRGATIGDQWFLTTTAPLFYPNPLGGDFQAEIGGAYHATEMFNFSGDLADLTDRRRAGAGVRVGWVRISDWLPWMKMGGREGLVYMHTAGRKLAKWEDLSPLLRAEVDARYPTFRAPPPVDDARPNETSLSAYKKWREAKASAQGGATGGGK
jgi:hypothetical protein